MWYNILGSNLKSFVKACFNECAALDSKIKPFFSDIKKRSAAPTAELNIKGNPEQAISCTTTPQGSKVLGSINASASKMKFKRRSG